MELFSLDDNELASKIDGITKKSKTVHKDWKETTKDEFRFIAGHQWDEDDLTKLTVEKKPTLVFNRCNVILSAVIGMESNQRMQPIFTPRESSDSGVSEAINEITDWVYEYGEIEQEDTESFEDMLVCGMGWSETRIDYDTDLDGQIVREAIDPLEMEWDDTAKKRNLKDARWICRLKKMPFYEVKNKWSDVDLTLTEEMLANDEESKIVWDSTADRYENKDTEQTKTTVLPVIKQFQWYETEPVYRVAGDATGKVIEVDEDKFKKMKDIIEISQTPYVKQQKRKYYEAFVFGNQLLEKKELASQKGFTFHCLTGKRDKMSKEWFGLGRLMKDPQKWANKFFSTFIDIVDSNSKGGVMAETNAVADVRKFEENWARADSVIWVNPGALSSGRIQPKPISQYPLAIDKLLQFAISSIYDVTGINLEMLGMIDRAEVGMVVEARKKSAYTIIAPFFDSFRFYRKTTSLTLLEFVKEYLPQSRIESVLADNLKQYSQFIKGIDLNQIDVVVSESPQSDNNKMLTWNIMNQMLPILLKSGVPVPPEILDYSPLPSAITEKWKALFNQAPSPEQQQEQQIQKELMAKKAMVDIQESGGKAALAQAKAVKAQADTQKVQVETQRKAMGYE